MVAGLLLSTSALAQEAGLRDELADTRQEREEAEERVAELREQEGTAQERLEATEQRLTRAEDELAALVEHLEERRAEQEAADEAAQQARERLDEVLERLAEAEDELAVASDRLERRVISAFKYGQVSLAEAFTGVRDMVDFINSTTYVSHVMAGDKHLVEQVTGLLEQVEADRAEAQQARETAEHESARAERAAEEVAAAVAQQEDLTAEVEAARADHEVALAELRDDRESMQGHLEGLEAESSRIQNQLAEIARQREEARREAERREAERREAERRASQEQQPGSGGGQGGGDAPSGDAGQAPPPATGAWQRPAAGRLSSGYGARWGRNHNGVDIANAVGSGVVATRAGTVVNVVTGCHPTSSWGCGGGFGNYVLVEHGDGFGTVYAHLSSVSVGRGQQVSQGQQVGLMGNSGNSYGSHLHFEVHDAGRPTDPCQYISC